jgi:hypothetical protein
MRVGTTVPVAPAPDDYRNEMNTLAAVELNLLTRPRPCAAHTAPAYENVTFAASVAGQPVGFT